MAENWVQDAVMITDEEAEREAEEFLQNSNERTSMFEVQDGIRQATPPTMTDAEIEQDAENFCEIAQREKR